MSYTSLYRQSSRSTLQISYKPAVAFHLIKQSLAENGFRLNGTSIPEQAQQRWNAPPQRTQPPESFGPAPVDSRTPATATVFTAVLFAGSAFSDLPRRRTNPPKRQQDDAFGKQPKTKGFRAAEWWMFRLHPRRRSENASRCPFRCDITCTNFRTSPYDTICQWSS